MSVVFALLAVVALRKESVDRNTNFSGWAGQLIKSLSARRAWIEIVLLVYLALIRYVALRKESVDRNTLSLSCLLAVGSSLSARRAWIEIM